MRTQKTSSSSKLVIAVFALGVFALPAGAQTPAPSPEPRKAPPMTMATPVILQSKPAAPQVVTILHSLNGLKYLRYLIRTQEQVEAIARLDEAFKMAGEVHTNVIAGLALGDGQTIAAWLPQVEAEMPPPAMRFVPRGWPPPAPPAKQTAAPDAKSQAPTAVGPMAIPEVPGIKIPRNFLEPDLRVITRDGKRILGHYVGLDGLTGLSLITLPNGSLPPMADSREEPISVGQRLRVIGPQPAPRPEVGARTPMYVRIGETEAMVTKVTRSPSGGIARVRIQSGKLSPANIGGIAINDAGHTLGIIDAVVGNEATIVPVALVRMAAKRVIDRQASVPRPWLGIRGEPIVNVSLERIQRVGWELQRARALAEKREGILLTSVAPGSPAALAKLKPGDVILSVNKGNVRNADDFTWLLDEAGPETPTLFTVARLGGEFSEALEIKLSESGPLIARRAYEKYMEKAFKPGSLLAEGIETIALKPRVASRLGSTGGVLVVSVQPSTEAFKAGLRAGDVIESIDGQPVHSTKTFIAPKPPGVKSTCVVVRNKEKVVLTFQYSTDRYFRMP